MLFELFDSFLTGLADTIEVGPIGMLTSPMPEIEADMRRICGCSVKEALFPLPSSSSEKEDKGRYDKIGILVVDKKDENSAAEDEKTEDDAGTWSVSADNDTERFRELIENINDIFSAKSDRVNLGLIYDHHRLNDYGKVILDTVGMDNYRSVACLSTEERVREALLFKGKCQKGVCDKCSFIFWSLMVLMVDATDQEERLSLICDFSRFLDINEEDMMNIIGLIRGATKMNA